MKKNLLGIGVTLGRYSSFVSQLSALAKLRQSCYVCVANVHMLIEARSDARFADVVNGAKIVTPDGMPLAKSFRLLYGIGQDRVAGMDLLPDLLTAAAEENIAVYFYGSTPEVLERTQSYCNNNLPHLNLAGMHSPPFRTLSAVEENNVVEDINASGAGFVFVALGCPKQEKWMASMQGRINACMIGIGGALPVMVGMQKRAPKLMQTLSLEWLYRMAQEPKRLVGRYSKTNFLFLYLVMREMIRIPFRRMPQMDLEESPVMENLPIKSLESTEMIHA